LYWYQKAADQGDAKAQSNLGVMYNFGEGVLKDYKQAVYWYQKAADQGYAGAQYDLGLSCPKLKIGFVSPLN
jgi:TPR repeat protein